MVSISVRIDPSYLRMSRVLRHICSYILAFWLVQNSVNKTSKYLINGVLQLFDKLQIEESRRLETHTENNFVLHKTLR